MVKSCSDKFIGTFWLKPPNVSIYTEDLIECSTVNDGLPSAVHVRK